MVCGFVWFIGSFFTLGMAKAIAKAECDDLSFGEEAVVIMTWPLCLGIIVGDVVLELSRIRKNQE